MILKLINPATNKIFKELSYHSWKDVKAQLDTAVQTQQKWKNSSIDSRITLVHDAMEYFKANKDTIALDITLQMGKPLNQSINEIKGMIHRAKICCDLAEDALKDIPLPEIDGLKRFIRRDPLGIILDIAAWNYPLLIAVNVIVPALLTGNAAVIKHSSLTPLCAIAFEDAFIQAGAP